MSETPGWGRPSEDPPRPDAEPGAGQEGADPQPPAEPPYPGWSTSQPPQPGWTAPGGDPSAPSAAAPPPAVAPATADQQSWGQPPAQPGWGSGTGWGWQPPTVKPGVIPLRPLGVGEILDGAVTTIRRNPGPMLGLSAIVAVVTQLLGLGLSWLLFREDSAVDSLSPTATDEEVLSALTDVFGVGAIVLVVTWVATVILTGILTVVVSRAVLGERLSAHEAWQAARRRLPKLLLLTLVYSLIWLAPFLVVGALALALGLAGADGDAGGGLAVLLLLAAIPVAIWLYVRYALAGPSLMLESTASPDGAARPVGVRGALRRSAALVRGSWWRVFGILLLVLLIVLIISNVISVPFSLPIFILGADASGGQLLLTLVLSALGGVVGATITAPFTAAATVLLYVDRRIRREGLDIDLARAAGVTIPGRTDVAPPPSGAP